MYLCIVEDPGYKNLYPLTKTRPSFALRCGRFTLEERIIKLLKPRPERVHYIIRPELEAVWRLRNKAGRTAKFDLPVNKGCLFMNGRVLFTETSLKGIVAEMDKKRPFVWKTGETWIAIYLPHRAPGFHAEELMSGTADLSFIKEQTYTDHAMIIWPWDLIRYNACMICNDFSFLKKIPKNLPIPPLPGQVAILNYRNLIIGSCTEIQPFVTFDGTEGPIIIGDHVKIEAGAYIKGPVSIGRNSLVSANTRLYANTTIGEYCKTGGEISQSIIHGFSNKRHDGFLGNSYLGEWVNIGAGSDNSNLKNNYNRISVQLNGRTVDTHSQFIGLFMGDHSRCAIGTRFNTATLAGVGCNIFGNGLTPTSIGDFTWGGIDRSETYDFQKFISSAKRMMVRREQKLGDEVVELLSKLHQSRLASGFPGRQNGSPETRQRSSRVDLSLS